MLHQISPYGTSSIEPLIGPWIASPHRSIFLSSSSSPCPRDRRPCVQYFKGVGRDGRLDAWGVTIEQFERLRTISTSQPYVCMYSLFVIFFSLVYLVKSSQRGNVFYMHRLATKSRQDMIIYNKDTTSHQTPPWCLHKPYFLGASTPFRIYPLTKLGSSTERPQC